MTFPFVAPPIPARFAPLCRLLPHAAAFACLFAGPCFQLQVKSRVLVDASGASKRTTFVQSTDTDRVDVRNTLSSDGIAPQAIVVLTSTPYERATPRFANGQSGKNAAAWTRTRSFDAGETAGDLSLHRRGRVKGAGNSAVVNIDDFVLFRRVRYAETIGDSSDSVGASAAAEALAGELCQIAQRAAENLFSRDFDLAILQQYLSTTARSTFRDFIVAMVDANSDHSSVVEGFVKVLERERIDAPFALLRKLTDGSLDSPEDHEKLALGLRRALLQKTAGLLRRPDSTVDAPGAPVTLDEIDRIATSQSTRLAFERAIESVSRKTVDDWSSNLTRGTDDLFGSFGGALFDPDLAADSITWTTRLRMPGTLLRTSGTPLTDGEILWHFLSGDLALRKTQCTAESIVLDDRAIAALGGVASTATPSDLLELLSDFGVGRDRRPLAAKSKILTDALIGDPEAREKLRNHRDFDIARRVFQLHP